MILDLCSCPALHSCSISSAAVVGPTVSLSPRVPVLLLLPIRSTFDCSSSDPHSLLCLCLAAQLSSPPGSLSGSLSPGSFTVCYLCLSPLASDKFPESRAMQYPSVPGFLWLGMCTRGLWVLPQCCAFCIFPLCYFSVSLLCNPKSSSGSLAITAAPQF